MRDKSMKTILLLMAGFIGGCVLGILLFNLFSWGEVLPDNTLVKIVLGHSTGVVGAKFGLYGLLAVLFLVPFVRREFIGNMQVGNAYSVKNTKKKKGGRHI